MKITINIDCTPEEARAFMGLPDMQAVQQSFMTAFQEQIKDAGAKLNSEDYMAMWKDMGQANMQAFQNMFWEQMKKAGEKKDKGE
jgi:hypothetical protein